MMKIKIKDSKKVFEVYKISNHINPTFLVYDEDINGWKWIPAINCTPYKNKIKKFFK